jgi:hypothetical protein
MSGAFDPETISILANNKKKRKLKKQFIFFFFKEFKL